MTEKIYQVFDGTEKIEDADNFDAAVIRAAEVIGEPIVICSRDGMEWFRVYSEDGRWWQEYSDGGRRRDVTKQMINIQQRLG